MFGQKREPSTSVKGNPSRKVSTCRCMIQLKFTVNSNKPQFFPPNSINNIPAFAASKISGLWKRSTVRYRRQYIHTWEADVSKVVTDGLLQNRENQTYLSALEPDVLQLIVNLPVTADAIEEPSEAGRPEFRFEIKVQKVDIPSFIWVSSNLYHLRWDWHVHLQLYCHEHNLHEVYYPWTVSWEYLSQKSTTVSSSLPILSRHSSSCFTDVIPFEEKMKDNLYWATRFHTRSYNTHTN